MGPESGEELRHFPSGACSKLVPVTWGLPRSREGPRQVQKASGGHWRGVWDTTDILLTPEKGMEARWEKLRDLRVAQDKGTHKKAVVWAMPEDHMGAQTSWGSRSGRVLYPQPAGHPPSITYLPQPAAAKTSHKPPRTPPLAAAAFATKLR